MDAKVDIRKLQFLNDRIAQVTDALNQVRLSVHGLQQPPFGLPQSQLGFQQPQFGSQQQLGFQQPQHGFQQAGYQQPPIGYQPQPGWPPQFGLQQPQLGFQPQGPYGAGPFGFQHSPYFGGLQLGGGLPFGLAGMPGGLPYPPQTIQGIQGIGQAGWGGGVQGWPPYLGGGLYHSPTEIIEQRLGEQRANDPTRILQTFPLCLSPAASGMLW